MFTCSMTETTDIRILFVPNEPKAGVLFNSALDGITHTLEIVDDVKQGLFLHHEHPFDIIFVDYRPDQANGVDTTKMFLEDGPDCRLFILTPPGTKTSITSQLPASVESFDISGDASASRRLLPGLIRLTKDLIASDRYAKILENKINELETVHQQAEMLADIGIWEWDEVDDKMLWCSEQHARIHGVSHDEYMASVTSVEADTEWVHPDDREYYLSETMRAYHDAEELDLEYRVLKRDGKTVYVREVSKPIIDDTGTVVRTIGTFQDITSLKLTEIEMRRAHNSLEAKVLERTAQLEKARDAAEAANQTKSQFLSTINHELRTPLTSIKGCLGLLNGLVSDEFSDTGRELLDMARRNADSLHVLINDLLDYEKNALGKLDIVLSPHNIIKLLQNVIEDSHGYAETFSVSFVLLGNTSPLWVELNEIRFGQVMLNLLSNAAKFSPPGTTVDISVFEKNNTVKVSVRDHGIGISTEHQNRVFEHFIQLDSSDSRHQGGTGLGLAITKSLVEKMHGTISVESKPAAGSTFTVSFPRIADDKISSEP